MIKNFPNFDSKIYLGGPVKTDSLFFIHTMGEEIEDSMPIIKGLYWGGDLEIVKEMIVLNRLNPENIRFYIGYSGWMPKQLEMELKRDSWVVSDIDVDSVMFANPDYLWKNTLEKLGGQYKLWTNFPTEPTLN